MLRLHTHAKFLVLPATALILLGGLLGVGTALVPSVYRPAGQYVVVVVVSVLAWWWSVVPFLRWQHRTYTLTTLRLISRSGVLSRNGRNLPLMRVLDVSYQRGLSDRVLGCGTLIVQTAAEGALVLDDVPDVEHVHQVLTDLLLSALPTPPQPPVPGAPWQLPLGSRS